MSYSSLKNKRLLALAGLLCCAFSLLLLKFYQLQVTQGEHWKELARRQHTFTTLQPAHRGCFFTGSEASLLVENEAKPLTVEVERFHLHLDPASLPETVHEEVAQKLTQWCSMDAEEISLEMAKKSRDRKVANWLTHAEKDAVLSWWSPFAKKERLARNALFFTSDFQRAHPEGDLLGQVLHTVQKKRDEVSGRALPTGGLELAFNETLHGNFGKKRLLRSPRNAIETGEVLIPPKDGEDVYLTIDSALQTICEEELARGLERTGGKAAWAVMMQPESGEILALAQTPAFDLENYSVYFNDPARIEETKLHALTDAFEPGSVMKSLTMCAALMANEELLRRGKKKIFDPEEKIPCADGNFPGRRRPIRDVSRHNYLNMDMALLKSSNIYMGRVVDRVIEALGNDWYYNVLAESFGLKYKSGIELPGESSGLMPKPGRTYANGKLQWSRPTPYSLAMGYNLQVNSFQLLRAWALLANRGILVNPTLLKGKQTEKKRVIPSALVERVVEGLSFSSGTKKADVPGYTEIGKSGTSRKIVKGQYSSKKHVVSFVGFAPHDKPEFVLLVMVDEPEVRYIPGMGPNNHGGVACAPVFREIAARSLAYLGTPQNDPHGFPPGDPRYDKEKAAWRARSKRLQDKYKLWNK